MNNEEPIRCPKCGSTQIHAEKRGFKTGRAIAGGLITGNLLITLAAGGIGKDNIELTCIKCGNKFKPGEGYNYIHKQPVEIKTGNGYVRYINNSEYKLYKCPSCGRICSIYDSKMICPNCGRRVTENDRHQLDTGNNFMIISVIVIGIVVGIIALLLGLVVRSCN